MEYITETAIKLLPITLSIFSIVLELVFGKRQENGGNTIPQHAERDINNYDMQESSGNISQHAGRDINNYYTAPPQDFAQKKKKSIMVQ